MYKIIEKEINHSMTISNGYKESYGNKTRYFDKYEYLLFNTETGETENTDKIENGDCSHEFDIFIKKEVFASEWKSHYGEFTDVSISINEKKMCYCKKCGVVKSLDKKL